MNICHACRKELSLDRAVGRRDECPHCSADLHCCLNCRFYDKAAPKQCREPVAELVRDKAKANFCDYFSFADLREAGKAAADEDKTRRSLDDLFRKQGGS